MGKPDDHPSVLEVFGKVQFDKDNVDPYADEVREFMADIQKGLRSQLGTSVGLDEKVVMGIAWVAKMCMEQDMDLSELHDATSRLSDVLVNEAAKLLAARRISIVQAMEMCVGGAMMTGVWVGTRFRQEMEQFNDEEKTDG